MPEVLYTAEPPERRWFTTRQAAEYLGVGKSTLEKWRGENRGPAFHRGIGRGRYGAVLYDRADLNEYAARHLKRHETADSGPARPRDDDA